MDESFGEGNVIAGLEALANHIRTNKKNEVRSQDVLNRYVQYVENKHSGIFGKVCLLLDDKYQAAVFELDLRFEAELGPY